MSQLITQQQIQQVRVPPPGSRNVWKEECSLSFHTQESEGGVLIDLNSWVAFSPSFVNLNFQKTGHALYLNIIKTYKLKSVENTVVDEKPKVLGIGVEGGFKTEEDKWEPVLTYAIVVLPNFDKIPLSSPDLPEKIKQAAEAIIVCDSAEKKEEIKTWVADAGAKITRYAENLVQHPANRNLSNGHWTCDVCGGDAKTNLWLNLTDGHIGCGRKIFDGSGGEGHALIHYEKTGFPLVVKLGTITAEGADVHSYPENEMVIDPHLEKHLAHWGLDMKSLLKTDKTLAEMEIELQHNFDWSRAQEKGTNLVPVYGPGFTGIQNLGNTCYMASVLQVLFKIPEFIDRYGQFENILKTSNLNEAPRDFHVQLGKLAHGLLSGDLSKPPPEKIEEEEKDKKEPTRIPTVRPFMLKSLIGEGHQEFSTNRQQDALEFLQYFLELVERREHTRGEGVDPSVVFHFTLQERLQCSASNTVKYSTTPKQNTLLLSIPIERATNKKEVEIYNKKHAHKTEDEKKKEREAGIAEDPVWPQVPLSVCFEKWAADEFIEDWYSPAIRSKTVAIKRKRFNDFPKYLILQMGRFVVTGHQYSKLDVFIDVPDELDLEHLRAAAPPPGELPFPADEEKPIQFNEEVINALMSMGFTRVRCEHAAFNTVGQGPEAAMEWLFGHLEDPTIDIPLKKTTPKPEGGGASSDVPEESITQLMNMGFDRNRCVKALKSTSNNVERALDWLFSHADDPMEESVAPTPLPHTTAASSNAPGKYRLLGFVTHMGKSTETGHYVAHIQSGGQWYIFNDQKVAQSQDPPRSMGYIYFYRRIDA